MTTRYERRMHFEALCKMREGYRNLSADDSTGTLLIEDAIIYSELVMDAIQAELADDIAALDAFAAAEATSEATGVRRSRAQAPDRRPRLSAAPAPAGPQPRIA